MPNFKKKGLYIALIIFQTVVLQAQNNSSKKMTYYTGEFNFLYSKINYLLDNDSLNALFYIKQADSISNLEIEKAKVNYLWGKYYRLNSRPYKALEYLRKSELFFLNQKDKEKLNNIKIEKLIAYFDAGEYKKSQKIIFSILTKKNLNNQQKTTIFYYLSKIYSYFKIYNQADIYNSWAFDIAKKNNDTKGIIDYYLQKGYILFLKDEYDSISHYYNKAFTLAKKIESKQLNSIYNRKAIYNYEIGQKDSCLYYLKKALIKSKERDLAVFTNNIGYFYFLQHQIDSSIKYLHKSEKYCLKYNFNRQLAITYDNLAQVYAAQKKYQKAYLYSRNFKILNDSLYKESSRNNMNEMTIKYAIQKKNKKIELLEKDRDLQKARLATQNIVIFFGILFSIFIIIIFIILYNRYKYKEKINSELLLKNEEINDQNEEILTQKKELERITEHLEQLSLAVRYTNNAVLIFDENHNLLWANKAFEKIYGFDLELITNNKKLFNYVEENEISNIDEILKNMNVSKKSLEFRTLRTNYKKQKIWVQSTISPYFDRNGKLYRLIVVETDISKIKKAEQKIKGQNKSIKESINYAKTLQKNILPQENEISKYLNHFLIYKAQEVISGDFYWMHLAAEIKFNWSVFVAMVDCSGHGVPGAFMSIIANSLLNRAIIEKQLYKPSTILSYIKTEFQKSYSHGHSEGFDIALCRIDKYDDEYTIFYSGAMLPIYYTPSPKENYEILKPDKVSIDARDTSVFNFSLKKIHLTEDCQIILSTDGIIDQPNNQRKRFGTTRFLSCLNNIKEKNLTEQKSKIKNTLANWLGEQEQRDDISILGIKLD